jgi:hypothetical protein
MSLHDLRTTTRRSSDLSKHPARIFAEAEEHPVQVTRRDGETLVLMSQREVDAGAQLLQLAADLITVTLDDEGTLATRMVQKFEWMRALSTADQEACARDLIHAARASFATGQAHLALAELTSWRETAAAVAAGLTGLPVEWLEDPAPAERP